MDRSNHFGRSGKQKQKKNRACSGSRKGFWAEPYISTGLYLGTRLFMMVQAIRYASPQKQNMMK